MRELKKRRIAFIMAIALFVCCIMIFSNSVFVARAEIAEQEILTPEPANLPTDQVVWSDLAEKYNALYVCYVTAPNYDQTLRFSSNTIFYPQSTNSVWITGKHMVYLPLDSNGWPYYKNAAAFVGDAQQTGPSCLTIAYDVTGAFAKPVTRANAGYIPTEFDQTAPIYNNVWEHNGSRGNIIIGTIVYQGNCWDFNLTIPLLGTKSTAAVLDGVTFTVRTGPNKVSVKASETVPITSINAFAFRLQ